MPSCLEGLDFVPYPFTNNLDPVGDEKELTAWSNNGATSVSQVEAQPKIPEQPT